jgi:hypothetical protein
MNTARSIFRFCAVCFGLAPSLAAFGQLADTSPFLAPGMADSAAAAAGGGTLELRGIMSTEDGLRFCIYEPAKKISSWVGVNESGHDYLVKGADQAHDTVTLQAAGRTFTVALHQAKITALSGPGIGLPTRELGPTAYPGPNGGRAFTPADEARRLEAIASEVRRRRLLREQADQAQDRAGASRNGYPPPQ